MQHHTTPDRILRRRDVETMTGLGRTGLYRMVAAGEFPVPRKLSERRSGWLLSEVQAWIASRRPASIRPAPVARRASA